MKTPTKYVLYAVGAALALVTLVLVGCSNGPSEPEEPVSKDCIEWMSDDTLTPEQETVVFEGCMFSVLPLEDEPVTLAEITVFYNDYQADMECAFSEVESPECQARLDHELTLAEVRNGETS